MKRFLVAIATACATASQASYLEALIYDSQNNEILRYDPATNIRLGSFGRGSTGTGSYPILSLDPTRRNEVATMRSDGGVRWLNFDSGLVTNAVRLQGFIGNTNTLNDFKIMRDGRLLVTAYFPGASFISTRIYNQSGIQELTLPSYSNYNYLANSCGPDGRVYRLSSSYISTNSTYQYFIEAFSSDGTLFYSSHFMNASVRDALTSMDVSGNSLVVVGGNGTPRVFKFALGANAISGGEVFGQFTPGGVFGFCAFGHGEEAFFKQRIDSGNFNYWYSINASGYTNQWTMPYFQNLASMVLIVAPEPDAKWGFLIALFLAFSRKQAMRRDMI